MLFRKFPVLTGKFQGYLESFDVIWKVSRLFGSFSCCLECFLRAGLTSSFAPFGRSGRVTHAAVSMMVSIMHISVILIVDDACIHDACIYDDYIYDPSYAFLCEWCTYIYVWCKYVCLILYPWLCCMYPWCIYLWSSTFDPDAYWSDDACLNVWCIHLWSFILMHLCEMQICMMQKKK